MRVALFGVGAAGSHTARQLLQDPVSELILSDPDTRRRRQVITAVRAVAPEGLSVRGGHPDPADPPDVVVLAGPAGTHAGPARAWLERGSDVVSLSDHAGDVTDLLALDPIARQLGRAVVVGAGFMPGLSCLLARYAADQLDLVEVISTYTAGTGGPACARQHHQALKRGGHDWIDGAWEVRRGGSGRELAWFPDPFGARDCYRAALPGPILLQPVFPDTQRISARMAATRRDRFTSWLPMLRPPHDDGGPGAIRVEVRGRRQGAVETVIVGVMDHPSVAGGTVAAVACAEVLAGRVPLGAGGLATWSDPKPILVELHRRGVRVATFEGLLSIAD